MNFLDSLAHDPAHNLVLTAGRLEDLPAIRAWLSELPADAAGQVFIESDTEFETPSVPAGIGVNRVPVFVEPGVALAEAVDSWLSEWMWVDACYERSLQLWTGADETTAMSECRARVQNRVGRRAPAVAQAVDLAS